MTAAQLPEQDMPAGALYVVGLPIGNLGDITLRALWVLSRVTVVAAEDTRETRKLLDRFGLSPKLLSIREHNERQGSEQIKVLLNQGERVALATDAGTPAVSDPGARVVDSLRVEGFRVIPIPGASAVVTALSAAGLLGTGFHFVGFVPPQAKARRSALEALAAERTPFVLYEAPHRIVDLLLDMAEVLAPSRRVVVAREITKKFESFTTVRAEELRNWAQSHEPRGEYVILVDEAVGEGFALSGQEIKWLKALAGELPVSRLAAAAAKATGQPRRVLYNYLLSRRDEMKMPASRKQHLDASSTEKETL